MSAWLQGVPPPSPPTYPVLLSGRMEAAGVRPRFLFENGEAAYFTGRFSLWCWQTTTGTFLCQQALELLIKGLIREDGGRPWGHDLVSLIENHGPVSPYFAVLLGDANKRELLANISFAYNLQRYGESGGQTRPLDLIQAVDEIVFNLRQEFLSKVRVSDYRSLVHPALLPFVLTNNLYYQPDHLVSDIGDHTRRPLPW